MVSKKEINLEEHLPCHLLSRAVDGKKIFIEESDCLRFIFQMYAANVGSPAFNLYRRDINKIARAILSGDKIPPKFIIVEHCPLVDFLSFALVVNHHHFMLASNVKGGISKYLQKLHCGFAKYFNLKHNRSDTLFERKYKIIPIKTDFQLGAVIRYINVKNPLDVYQPNWKEKGLKNEKEALNFLNSYQFSSFPDLFGNRKSKIIIPESKLEKYCGHEIIKGGYMNFVKDYLKGNLVPFSRHLLEEDV